MGLRNWTDISQIESTLSRSYTFGPCQPNLQSFCLKKNKREIVSGIFFNEPQLNHRVITHVGVTCKPSEFSAKYSALSSRCFDCPERLNRYKWFLSNASLAEIAKVQLCRDDRWPNRPYVGILITYKNESQTTLGQWRWDASLELEMIPFDEMTNFTSCTTRCIIILSSELNFILEVQSQESHGIRLDYMAKLFGGSTEIQIIY